jgi:hypothetical protein
VVEWLLYVPSTSILAIEMIRRRRRRKRWRKRRLKRRRRSRRRGKRRRMRRSRQKGRNNFGFNVLNLSDEFCRLFLSMRVMNPEMRTSRHVDGQTGAVFPKK